MSFNSWWQGLTSLYRGLFIAGVALVALAIICAIIGAIVYSSKSEEVSEEEEDEGKETEKEKEKEKEKEPELKKEDIPEKKTETNNNSKEIDDLKKNVDSKFESIEKTMKEIRDSKAAPVADNSEAIKKLAESMDEKFKGLNADVNELKNRKSEDKEGGANKEKTEQKNEKKDLDIQAEIQRYNDQQALNDLRLKSMVDDKVRVANAERDAHIAPYLSALSSNNGHNNPSNPVTVTPMMGGPTLGAAAGPGSGMYPAGGQMNPMLQRPPMRPMMQMGPKPPMVSRSSVGTKTDGEDDNPNPMMSMLPMMMMMKNKQKQKDEPKDKEGKFYLGFNDRDIGKDIEAALDEVNKDKQDTPSV